MQHLPRPEFLRTLLAALALLAVATAYAVEDRFVAAAFSAARPGTTLPAGWVPLEASNIKVRTRYTLVDDNGTTVLRADSERGASGLSRQLRINPSDLPWLRWRWKISNLIETADLRTKDGDDFPARIYVMFDYPIEKLPFLERNKLRLARTLFDPNLPAATLCYVWDSKAAAETIASSAYTDRVKIIVVESGASRVRQWVNIERNIAGDFRAAFGEEAPPVSAIAVATDTDNTGTFATAHFGDISFNKHKVTVLPTSEPAKP
jgi:hypothetical protein